MALKFLNKKGWHTGSLRNIENVWKAEQKHDAEQKKLDELRKQIQEERERSEFRQLQEQAGLVPRQERLDFLYDSGLAVGRSDGGGASASASGSGFQALDQASSAAAPSSAKQQSSTPGALFEDKPHSASDAWRKLHSDPLLLIRQREQEALARVKNNPIKMAQIRKSVEEKKHKDKPRDKKDRKNKKHKKHSDSEYATSSDDEKQRKSRNHKRSYCEEEHHHNKRSDSGDELSDRRDHRKNHYKDSKYRERSPSGLSESKRMRNDAQDFTKRNYGRSKLNKYSSEGRRNYDDDGRGRENKTAHDDDDRRGTGNKSYYEANRSDNSALAIRTESNYRRRNAALAPKISEEERAARLREMQVNADLHEEQRWKRLRKAEEDDARDAIRDGIVSGKNFLETAKKSVFGAEKGGSSTIEESVRRRTHYLQGRSESEGNAFRR